jgi:UDP-N-acetylmuramate dehydrogenase
MLNYHTLVKKFSEYSLILKCDEKLDQYTTIGIGGNAKYFVEVTTSSQLNTVINLSDLYKISRIIIGKGSNLIISDAGFDGLTILNESNNWQVLGKTQPRSSRGKSLSRFKAFEPIFPKIDTFNISETKTETKTETETEDVLVQADSGLKINILSKLLYKEGITGLEWFAGIPSSVGGAIYMNMHGGNHFFGDLLESAYITDGHTSKEVGHDYFNFDYDSSILQKTKEVVLHAKLCLKKGDVKKAKQLAKSWAQHKSQQPKRSAGCIFRNLNLHEQKKLGLPSPSVGYLIDHILKLKGKRCGDAIISTKHAAFIENLGRAKAKDVFELINLIKDEAKKRVSIDLQLEVELIGKF